MEYYIGIDSGGTKTKAVMTDPTGRVIRKYCDIGCNPLDVGGELTCRVITSCVRELLTDAPGEIVSVYAGVAGANHVALGLEEKIRTILPGAAVRIEDDRRIVLSGTLGHADGCGMICGTGSSLSIIRDGKPIRQVGGLGYLIDTGGSGYELGRSALKYAFRYLDGRGEYTVLAQRLSDTLGKNLWENLSEIYAGGRPFIASLAHTVFEAAAEGDAVAQSIMRNEAYCLSELTFAAEKCFDGPFPIVMTGGIFQAYPEYVEMVRSGASPRAEMQMAAVPPVYGAIVEAMWQKGICADESVKDNFMADISEANA